MRAQDLRKLEDMLADAERRCARFEAALWTIAGMRDQPTPVILRIARRALMAERVSEDK